VSEEHIVIELNPRDRRLYDRMRSRVIDHPPGDGSGIRDMALLLPDLTVLLARLIRDDRVPIGSKALAMAGIGYVLSPVDLVPGLVFGPIGLVDDLVIAAATLSRLLNHVHPDVVRSHWSGQGDALEVIHRITRWAEQLFTVRLKSLLFRRTRIGSR
jgi:uncharacterized membrane protein YkvA (DUF1232 family)